MIRKRFGNGFRFRSAADVKKVRRLAAVKLDDVHRAHRESSTVDEAADVAFKFDVAEAGIRRADFGFFFFRKITHLGDFRLAKQCV